MTNEKCQMIYDWTFIKRYRDVVLTSWDRGLSDSVPFLHT